MDSSNLRDGTAIITGATSGIGRATAVELAKEGMNTALVARTKDDLDAVGDELESSHGVQTLQIPANVRNKAEMEEVVQTTKTEFDTLDLLVNNVATSNKKGVGETTTEEFEEIIETNIHGLFYITRAALPHLREARGNVVCIGSIGGKYPRSINTVYCATKWFTRGFAYDLQSFEGENIGVSVINPSDTRTGRGSGGKPPKSEIYEEGDALEPEEIANAVVYAASQKPTTSVVELNLFHRDALHELQL